MDDVQNSEESDVTVISDEELDKKLIGDDQDISETTPEAVNQEPTEKPEGSEVKDKDAEPSFATKDEEINYLKDKLKKRVLDNDSYTRSLETKVGSLRKEKEELSKTIPDENKVREEYFSDPIKGAREVLEIDKKQARLKELEHEEFAAINRIQIERQVPNYSELIDEMVAMAKEDGEDERNIELFKKDPHSLRYDVAVIYARRALERRKNSDVLKSLDDLKKTVNELKGKPESIVKQINDLGKKRPIGTDSGASRSSKSYDDLSDSDYSSLSDAELDEILKKDK